MSTQAKRRPLRFEPLEPRWTMNAAMDAGPGALGCELGPINPASETCAPAANTTAAWPTEVQLVEQALNQFALDLYQTITAANATQPADTAISPVSIAAALAMTYAGAKGETASQIAAALHVDLPPDRFHAAMQSILHDLLPGADSKVQLEMANSLWGQAGFPLLASFQQLLHDRYDAEFHEVNFVAAADDAKNAINDWVKTQTQGMIEKLFDQLDSDTRLVLANALYFKASWAQAFETYATQREAFRLAGGGTLDVAMMHQSGNFGYTETSDYQIAKLPYEGGQYSMVVLLPKQPGANLAADFSASDLQTWLGNLQPSNLAVALPKFKLETSLSLVKTLQSLGITDAFGGSADFSGIDGKRDLYVSQAVHKAVVEVNETGTKAAAATGIEMTAVTEAFIQVPTFIPFTADHPFHFLIRDRQTNSILFLGQVQKPTPFEENQPPDSEPVQLTPAPPTTNPANPFDVNADGDENTLDALLVINYLNDHMPPAAPQQSQIKVLITAAPKIFADVDGDGYVAPIDALLLINRLNDRLANTQLETHSAVEALFAQDDLASLASGLPAL